MLLECLLNQHRFQVDETKENSKETLMKMKTKKQEKVTVEIPGTHKESGLGKGHSKRDRGKQQVKPKWISDQSGRIVKKQTFAKS